MAGQIIPVPDKHMVGHTIGRWIVLWTVRERGPLDFPTLYEMVYGYPEYGPSQINFITRTLHELHSIGLVKTSRGENVEEFMRTARSTDCRSGSQPELPTLEVTPMVDRLQFALGLSVTDYAKGKGEQLTVDPMFGRPWTWKRDSWPQVFVLMPFCVSMRPVFDDHIAKVAKSLSIICERCDDFFSTESIIGDIWSALFKAQVCIADCTGRNPNVFYELGIAHTLGRPTVLISQTMDDVPFDIRHRRVIVYEYTPRGMKTFEKALRKTLESELNGIEQPEGSDE